MIFKFTQEEAQKYGVKSKAELIALLVKASTPIVDPTAPVAQVAAEVKTEAVATTKPATTDLEQKLPVGNVDPVKPKVCEACKGEGKVACEGCKGEGKVACACGKKAEDVEAKAAVVATVVAAAAPVVQAAASTTEMKAEVGRQVLEMAAAIGTTPVAEVHGAEVAVDHMAKYAELSKTNPREAGKYFEANRKAIMASKLVR